MKICFIKKHKMTIKVRAIGSEEREVTQLQPVLTFSQQKNLNICKVPYLEHSWKDLYLNNKLIENFHLHSCTKRALEIQLIWITSLDTAASMEFILKIMFRKNIIMQEKMYISWVWSTWQLKSEQTLNAVKLLM